MNKLLRWPWAQAALWVVGVLALLIGAGNDYGPNWGAIALGAVFVAAAIALAFLRVLRKRHEPAPAQNEAPARSPQELRQRQGRRRLMMAAIILLLAGSGLTITAQNFSKHLQRYEGVAMNATRADVLYLRGYPPVVLSDIQGPNGGWQSVYYTDRLRDPRNAMPEGKRHEDYHFWNYEARQSYEADVTIKFDAHDRVENVSCIRLEDARGTCSPLFGVRLDDSEEAVVARLGNPTSANLDGVAKFLTYEDIGAEYTLTRGRVYRMRLRRDKGPAAPLIIRYFRGWLSWW